MEESTVSRVPPARGTYRREAVAIVAFALAAAAALVLIDRWLGGS